MISDQQWKEFLDLLEPIADALHNEVGVGATTVIEADLNDASEHLVKIGHELHYISETLKEISVHLSAMRP